ncbi:hypothetical protein DFH11DRAFT_1512447 [Phellopilus nigrolimitatus]|nr:hypothetical protein DFH11DRAFT_1512447 [Phellopilus nigrolimitatus]
MATAALTTTTKAYTHTFHVENEKVLLRARPYARYAGHFVLVPLLPKRTPLQPLPAELWRKVSNQREKEQQRSKWDLALVCKDLKNIVLPLLYEHCKLSTLRALEKFTAHLYSSDQKWDSLRRIPYSTPGRWVLSLNLCDLQVSGLSESCKADALLSTLFPLLPFLAHLELSLSLQLSRRAMLALGLRDGAQNLRSLSGVKYDASMFGSLRNGFASFTGEDPLTELVSSCSGLEELEVIGAGMDDVNVILATNLNTPAGEPFIPTFMPPSHLPSSPPVPSLHLPHLHTLTLLATPTSSLLFRLVHSSLPSLRSVVITPYGDFPPPFSLVTDFLAAHGQNVRSIVLHTPKSWPTVRFPPPAALLQLLPNLTALSLESIGPTLDAPYTPLVNCASATGYPLKSLWVSRPTHELRDELLRLLPYLPHLREVHSRDVRWAKRGISARARSAGFQGEMSAWRYLLAPRGIRMLDVDGREESA